MLPELLISSENPWLTFAITNEEISELLFLFLNTRLPTKTTTPIKLAATAYFHQLFLCLLNGIAAELSLVITECILCQSLFSTSVITPFERAACSLSNSSYHWSIIGLSSFVHELSRYLDSNCRNALRCIKINWSL